MYPNIINVTWLVLLKLILLYCTEPGDRQDCEKCQKTSIPYSTVSTAQLSLQMGAVE